MIFVGESLTYFTPSTVWYLCVHVYGAYLVSDRQTNISAGSILGVRCTEGPNIIAKIMGYGFSCYNLVQGMESPRT